MGGGNSLPRKSGDLVFHDEWEKRAFAMAVALHESGYYQWEEFRSILISEINLSGGQLLTLDLRNPGIMSIGFLLWRNCCKRKKSYS